MNRVLISCCLFLLASMAVAEPQQFSLQLKKVEPVKIGEYWGEELYVSVTEFPVVGRPSIFRTPQYPLHWHTKFIEKIKNIPVWKKKLADGETTTLLVELIDQDAAPWNNDDLIGELKLRMKNDKGNLVAEWSIPNKPEVPVQKAKLNEEKKFELGTEKEHDYKVTFAIQK